MSFQYICSICNTKNNIYYAGEYECKKCKRKFSVNKQLEMIGEKSEEESDNDESEGVVHRPNYVPIKQRVWGVIFGVLVLIYGIWGISRNDLAVPLGKRDKRGFHLHGIFVYIGFMGLLCFFGYFISFIIDHYDKRDNENVYKKLQIKLGEVAFALFVGAAIVQTMWQIILLVLGISA